MGATIRRNGDNSDSAIRRAEIGYARRGKARDRRIERQFDDSALKSRRIR
jgi:hypothetical protein